MTLLTDEAGAVVNKFDYEPFGTPTLHIEGKQTPYKFVGQWGVRVVSSLQVGVCAPLADKKCQSSKISADCCLECTEPMRFCVSSRSLGSSDSHNWIQVRVCAMALRTVLKTHQAEASPSFPISTVLKRSKRFFFLRERERDWKLKSPKLGLMCFDHVGKTLFLSVWDSSFNWNLKRLRDLFSRVSTA